MHSFGFGWAVLFHTVYDLKVQSFLWIYAAVTVITTGLLTVAFMNLSNTNFRRSVNVASIPLFVLHSPQLLLKCCRLSKKRSGNDSDVSSTKAEKAGWDASSIRDRLSMVTRREADLNALFIGNLAYTLLFAFSAFYMLPNKVCRGLLPPLFVLL